MARTRDPIGRTASLALIALLLGTALVLFVIAPFFGNPHDHWGEPPPEASQALQNRPPPTK